MYMFLVKGDFCMIVYEKTIHKKDKAIKHTNHT